MLNKTDLKNSLKSLFNDMNAEPMTEDTLADRLANIIHNYILSAEIDSATTSGDITPSGKFCLVTGGPLDTLMPTEVKNIAGKLK